MSDLASSLDELRRLHERLDVHDAERKTLMRERDQALRAAKDAGATYEAIKEATGLHNEAIRIALRRSA